MKTNLAPLLVRAHLEGDIKALKAWCGEGVFNKLSADIRARKQDGIFFDVNILDFEESQLVMRSVEDRGPIIVGVYMVQQINCIRDKEGNIKEGAVDDVRAKFYSMAFQPVYDEEQAMVRWQLVDYELAGDIAYL